MEDSTRYPDNQNPDNLEAQKINDQITELERRTTILPASTGAAFAATVAGAVLASAGFGLLPFVGASGIGAAAVTVSTRQLKHKKQEIIKKLNALLSENQLSEADYNRLHGRVSKILANKPGSL